MKQKEKAMYDILIIGAGIAGLSAGIYSARYALKTIILSKDVGGLTATAHDVCNYPGFERITGFELMNKVKEQVKKLNVPIISEEVLAIIKSKDVFTIKTNKNEYNSKKVIFSIGRIRRRLNIPGEKEFLGKGVSYCATCDSGFFREKTVIIVGGSNAALSAAILLSKFAKKVYLIHRSDKFTKAEPIWINQVKAEKKIEIMLNEELAEIHGDERVNSVTLKSGKKLKTDGIFIEIGSDPNLSLIENMKGLELDEGFVRVDKNMKTSIGGLYAAGDITNNELKQIVTAASQGAIAAYSCYNELNEEKE